MSRIEYMRRLAALLQDVPVEERVAAMQYYNDYFDDAGEENEEQVIAELGSPEKVAAEVKAGLGRKTESSGEFTETGYADTQFEEKDMPAEYRKPWTSRGLKILLIVLIVLAVAPFLIPVAVGIVCCVLGLSLAAFLVFVALVIAAAAVAVTGIALFVKGGLLAVSNIAVSFVIMGIGLLLAVIGTIATVAAVRLCIIVLPGLFRLFVELCRKPFQKRRAVA